MFRMMIAALALAGCATNPTPQAVKERVKQEQGEDGVRRMQDEFNTIFPDA